jgi:tetratricopeptide (TPR) repeat protein
LARDHPEYGYAALTLAETYIQAGRFDAGRVMLQKALLVSPDYANSETGMASVAGLYGRMGDFEPALALCSQVLAAEPNLYSALYNCGNIDLLAGHYAEAERLLSHAIEVAPEQAAPKHYLGRALLEDGKNHEAQPYLATAATMDPKVWDYHYWLAESLERSGNIPAARAQYLEALRLNPDGTEAKMRLAAMEGK